MSIWTLVLGVILVVAWVDCAPIIGDEGGVEHGQQLVMELSPEVGKDRPKFFFGGWPFGGWGGGWGGGGYEVETVDYYYNY